MASSASSATRRTSRRIAQAAKQKKRQPRTKNSTATHRTENGTGIDVRKSTSNLATRQEPSLGGIERQSKTASRPNRELVYTHTVSVGAVKFDGDKADFSLLTQAMLEPMTRALMYGERKYSRGNFREGFENVRLTSAALRHIYAYLNREELDPESGVSHLGHAMAALAMLLDNIAEGVSTDVRYEKTDIAGPLW